MLFAILVLYDPVQLRRYAAFMCMILLMASAAENGAIVVAVLALLLGSIRLALPTVTACLLTMQLWMHSCSRSQQYWKKARRSSIRKMQRPGITR